MTVLLIFTTFYFSAANTDAVELLEACEVRVEDPLASRSGGLVKAQNQGVSISRRDFLLYMATVRGEKALRNRMVPCLIDSLRNLQPTDDIIKACKEANNKIWKLVKAGSFDQIPEYDCTLTRDFFIGQDFSKLK